MESLRLNILLEHLNLKCKYYVEDGGSFCERAWANTERTVLKCIRCEGYILKCELNEGTFIRRVA